MSKPKLRMLSLCSGIGGADLAAEWTGTMADRPAGMARFVARARYKRK